MTIFFRTKKEAQAFANSQWVLGNRKVGRKGGQFPVTKVK